MTPIQITLVFTDDEIATLLLALESLRVDFQAHNAYGLGVINEHGPRLKPIKAKLLEGIADMTRESR